MSYLLYMGVTKINLDDIKLSNIEKIEKVLKPKEQSSDLNINLEDLPFDIKFKKSYKKNIELPYWVKLGIPLTKSINFKNVNFSDFFNFFGYNNTQDSNKGTTDHLLKELLKISTEKEAFSHENPSPLDLKDLRKISEDFGHFDSDH